MLCQNRLRMSPKKNEVVTQETKESVLNELKKIHVPAEVLESSVKVYGYREGNVDYL